MDTLLNRFSECTLRSTLLVVRCIVESWLYSIQTIPQDAVRWSSLFAPGIKVIQMASDNFLQMLPCALAR